MSNNPDHRNTFSEREIPVHQRIRDRIFYYDEGKKKPSRFKRDGILYR